MTKREDAGRSIRLFSHAWIACVAVLVVLGIARTAYTQSDARKKIAFVGDSMSDGLWGGTSQILSRSACLKANLELGRYAKNSTGLTRPDRFDWAAEVKKIGDSFKPQLFVMSLGLNDRQSVAEKGQVILDTSPLYPARYKERVTAVLKNVVASNAGLLWVGLPAIRAAAPDKDARSKNSFFAEAIKEFGVPEIQYVAPWKLNPSAEVDVFSSYGPDQNGKMIQLRASDGEHFTPSGEFMVAAYMLPRILASVAANGEPLCAKTDGAKTEGAKLEGTKLEGVNPEGAATEGQEK